jgi:uncharacterized repeat protein (TIGR04076 family)
LLLAGGAVVPVVAVVALLAADKPEAAGIIGALMGVYLVVVAPGIYLARTAKGRPEWETMDLVATGTAAAASGVEWGETVPLAPLWPVTVQVASAAGVCALGFRPGDTWVIDANGRISRPLCRPMTDALSSLLRAPLGEVEQSMACVCPLPDRRLVFTVAARE